MNNNTLIPEKYQECFSKLNRLKPLNSSRIDCAILSGETTYRKPFAWPVFVALIAEVYSIIASFLGTQKMSFYL
jgi:hypothetical protein